MNTSQQCNILPLDVELLIRNLKEEMLKKGTHLKEANRSFEVALMVLVLKKFTGDERKAAKLLGINKKELFCRLNFGKIKDNWWRWDL